MPHQVYLFMVDDDRDDVSLFEEVAAGMHRPVRFQHAINGADALEKLRSAKTLPDIIFMDLNMPRMDGRECLAALKSDKRLASIPVIIYTTSSQQRDIDYSMKQGAAFFLTKPTSMKALHKILSPIVESLVRHNDA